MSIATPTRILQGLGEFFRESALRTAVHALTPHPAAARRFPGAARRTIAHRTLTLRPGSRRAAGSGRTRVRTSTRSRSWSALAFRLGGLGGIGTQQAILKGRPVEAANDRVHFLGIRSVNKREALGLLRFGIADYFNCVRDQVLGTEPALDIVRGYPSGQIAQEYGKTHSVIVFNSVGGGLLRGGYP